MLLPQGLQEFLQLSEGKSLTERSVVLSRLFVQSSHLKSFKSL